MNNSNDNTFITINSEGKEVICEILISFDSDLTGKSYVVYTDYSKDETNGNTRVFASVLFKTMEGDHILLPIETDREWKMIEAILEEIQISNDFYN